MLEVIITMMPVILTIAIVSVPIIVELFIIVNRPTSAEGFTVVALVLRSSAAGDRRSSR
jgi:hypothetical protein